MNKKKLFGIVIGVIIGLLIFISIILSQQLPKSLVINSIDMSLVADATYTGECDNGLVKAIVEVKVSGHEIRDIKIVKHQTGKGQDAVKIVDSIIEKQSLEVDAITSATYSSETILKAAENALQQGIN